MDSTLEAIISTVDGVWNQWASWSTCSKTCGLGDMTRSRTCNYTAGAPHGTGCSGQKSEQSKCNTQQCPGKCNKGLSI